MTTCHSYANKAFCSNALFKVSDKQTDGQTDRETDRPTDGQTDRQVVDLEI